MVLGFLGDIGGSELLVVGVVALLVLGPQRLPEVARKVGTLLGQFRRASTDLQRQLNNELRDVKDLRDHLTGPSLTDRAASWASRLGDEPAPPPPPAPAAPEPPGEPDGR